MNIQGNNDDQAPYKIVFSNILCKININDQELYGLVIRLGILYNQYEGKKSSKYSEKKAIINGTLQLISILSVPFDGRVLSNQNLRKDKCEIMLYRYKVNGERESKELIGMASLGVGNQLFESQTRKLRLTNSNDKQAIIQCTVKIQLGEADILQFNESKMSSFFLKSNQNSRINEYANNKTKQIQTKNIIKNGIVTSNSQKSFSIASESLKEDNSFLQILNVNSPQRNYNSNIDKTLSKSQSQMIAVTQPSASSEKLLPLQNQFDKERNHLLSVCNGLQKQNQLLISKIQNLENQLFNQSIISNVSNKSVNDRPPIPRPAGSIKRSPMIKKNNNQITVTPSFQKQGKDYAQCEPKTQQKQLITQKSAGSLHSYKKNQIKNNQSRNPLEQQSSPYFSIKNPVQEIQVLATIEESQIISQLTFAAQNYLRKNVQLSINNVIGVTFKPPVNVRKNHHQMSYQERQNSVINHSVSYIERNNSRSYQKFDGKKKYKAIGAVKGPDQSPNVSYLQQSNNNDRKSGSSFISKPPNNQKKDGKTFLDRVTQNQGIFNIFKGEGQSAKKNNPNVFLDFLNENDKEQQSSGFNISQAFRGILQPSNSKQNMLNQPKTSSQTQSKSRVTLEELDLKTQERFRKNQRALKIANMRMLQENIVLKKQKRALEEIISQKKQLSHQEFQNLRKQIKDLTEQVQSNKASKAQNQSKLTELLGRCENLEEENSRLKKEIKEQKSKYEYYLKISNINDHKDKVKDQKKGSQFSIQSKKTSIKHDSQIFNSIIEPGQSASKNQPVITSIMNISNNREESNKRRSMIDSKSLKKVDFTLQEKTFDEIKLSTSYYEKKTLQQTNKPNIPKPTSSFAVSRLKEQLKSGIQRKNDDSISRGNSPINNSFSGSGFGSGYKSGLMGTGDTIVPNGLNGTVVPNGQNVFSSFGRQ